MIGSRSINGIGCLSRARALGMIFYFPSYCLQCLGSFNGHFWIAVTVTDLKVSVRKPNHSNRITS